ncbi:MAG: hypothetical protein ACE5H9_12950 [Anaerolineae bacterium]
MMNEKLRELNAELEVLNESIAELARLERFERLTRRVLEDAQRQLAVARERFRQEMDDVIELERLSLEHLWHSVLGDLRHVLSQEEHEVVIAASVLKLAADEVRHLSVQLRKTQVKIRRLGDPVEEKMHLLREKEALLLEINDATARATQARFSELQDRLAHKRDQLIEVVQALAETKALIERLETVRQELATLEAWQTEDPVEEGVMNPLEKYDYLGRVTRGLQKTQQAIGQLVRELTNLDRILDISLKHSAFEIFSRGFLQGFYVGWLIQERLDEAQLGLNGIEHFAEKVRGTLEETRKRLAREIGLLEAEMHRLVEGWT